MAATASATSSVPSPPPKSGAPSAADKGLMDNARHVMGCNRPISMYRFPRRAPTHCPQLSMGIQSDARFPMRSADALPATLYGHSTQAIYRNRSTELKNRRVNMRLMTCRAHCPPVPAALSRASTSSETSARKSWTVTNAGSLFGSPVIRGSHSCTFQLNLSQF
jgi:hypothetical protein